MGVVERVLCWLFSYDDKLQEDGQLYLRRWFLIGRDDSNEPLETRRGHLCLHKFYRGDTDRDPHNHPGAFRTLVVSGEYWDEQWTRYTDLQGSALFRTGPKLEHMKRWSTATRQANHLHRVVVQTSKPVWTLVWFHKPTQPWGFVLEDGSWIPSKTYLGE